MSIFAGIVALDRHAPIREADAEALTANLSRDSNDRPVVIRGPGYLLAQIHLPSQPHAARFIDSDGSTTLLAGDPLLDVASAESARCLHAALGSDDLRTLATGRGAFCAVHWDAGRRSVRLVTDKLGLRPIYYAVREGCLLFSTALRVFEAAGLLTEHADVRGVTELAAFGYPLAARTPYAAIRVLRSGEVVSVTNGKPESRFYWSWDLPARHELPSAADYRTVLELFMAATRRRLDAERIAVAGLSGGLDSRCIVSALQALGATVHTFNFAPPGSADLELGRRASVALGTSHREFPHGPNDFWDRMLLAYGDWIACQDPAELPQNPHQLWSGDGGSCGLGHIYLDHNMITRLRRGDTAEAIEAYLAYNRIGLPAKLLRQRHRAELLEYLRSGIAEELARFPKSESGRRLHLFLLENGQRRLLAKHYENLDLRRFELVTPFFDADLLEAIVTRPIDDFLMHHFYNRWLDEFPPAVQAAPWQPYPDHETGGPPMPPGLRSQWDGWYDPASQAHIREKHVRLADEIQRRRDFPDDLLDRRVLRLARWLTRMRAGNYSHVIRCADTYSRYRCAAQQQA